MTLKELVAKTKLYLFDLDGTLYLSENVFDFSADLLKAIKARGAEYRFITNNSSKGPKDYVEKMARLGIEATENEFVSSGLVTTIYMQENFGDEKLYVCGTESLKTQFTDVGLKVTEDIDEAGAIVIGCDTELTFKKIDDICRTLSERPKIPYIATHPDMTCPTNYGYMPDCGALANMIFEATGKRPVVIGKPTPLMPELAMQKAGYTREQTVVIGDRLDTDIACGKAAETMTILVYTGHATPEILAKSSIKPNLVLKSCKNLLDELNG